MAASAHFRTPAKLLALPETRRYFQQMESGHYDGMTVNERLLSAGLIKAFDAAAERQDRDALIAILSRVALVDPEVTADTVLAAPHCNGG